MYTYIFSILFWPALRIFVSFKIERGDFRIPAVDQIQMTSLSQKNHEGKNKAYHMVILTWSSVSQDDDQPRHNKFAILRPRSDENLIATDWVLVCTVSFLSIRGIWSRVQLLRLIYMYISAMLFFSFCIQVHIRSIQMPESMHVSSIVDEKRKNKVYKLYIDIYIYI